VIPGPHLSSYLANPDVQSNSADFTKTSGDVTIASACSAAGTFGVEVSATHKICAQCPAGELVCIECWHLSCT
jgi:hypothetical protein